MSNLYHALKEALSRELPYPILSFTAGSVAESAKGIATPQSTLLLQIDSVERLEDLYDRAGASHRRYLLHYRLAMRYEEALEGSCMNDLLELALWGAQPRLERVLIPIQGRRSAYVMQLNAQAIVEDLRPSPSIKMMQIQLTADRVVAIEMHQPHP
ncbi:hypothetical protein PVA45_07810 (plasmid) [Entomospira entomophila]|uniref:Uncharacterized protein n=1 Tax=Entomospira entomophila TaxID=2719988 RepID=A0A968GE75_9SPIO|nr:hypothetical protein [Entomospira entomophilus]NIZ41409.1 hypothetical protein [Entomospira entomophilus]WDI36359.1 hypothetical protein PVA45_07810 [Entomospira entomophilus]